MGRSLYLANSYSALFDKAREFIGSGDALVLAPSRGAADDLLRTLPRGGCAGVHAATLTQVAARLATGGDTTVVPLSRLGQEALVARLVYEFNRAERLHYFEPVANLPGFPRALARTLSELRMEGVSWDALAKTGDPGRDLSLLARDYAAQLAEAGLADIATLFELAIERIDHGSAPLPAGLPLLVLDAPIHFVLEKKLLAAIAARAPRVLAVSLAADVTNVQNLLKSLKAIPATLPETQTTTLHAVRERLFRSVSAETKAPDNTVEIFSAPGEGLEAIEIARRILALAEAGTKFDEVAVGLRNVDRYQPMLEEAFRRAGIPAWFAAGATRPDPAGRAFLALLRCAAERCSASRFGEYLSLGQLPQVDEHGAPQRNESPWTPPQDEILAALFSDGTPEPEAPAPQPAPPLVMPAAWENLLVDAAVVGGPGRWKRRLDGLRRELELQHQQSDGEGGETARATLERRMEQLETLRRFALPLIERLAALPPRAVWGAWLDQLTALAQSALPHPEGVIGTLEELRPMAEVGPVSLEVVYTVLEDRLRFLRRDPPRYRFGAVFVASLEQIRGREFPIVFVPGLAEGIFPKRASEDPLLLDLYRRSLKPPLPGQDDRVATERLLLHTAAAVATRALVVSYPRIDVGQSRPRVPSFYALEVVRAATGALPDLKEFEREAAAGAQTRLGWPAPADPLQALDDAEYDLATLDHLTRLPPGLREGAARYLVDVSPPLARSLRTRWRRWHKPWTSADGLIQPDPQSLDLLQKHRLTARAYSPTSLQHFSSCPYRFFLHAIQRLRPREEAVPLDRLDPLTRGALFHEAQETVLAALRPAGLLPLSMANLDRILDIGDQTLNHVASAYEEQLAPAIPRVWASEIDELRLDLRGWLRHAAQQSPEWMPLHTEYKFGLDTETPEVILPGGQRLRGSVDLVEQSGDEIRVTDHKTGRFPDKPPVFVGGGRVLQPVLYALAMESLLNHRVDRGRLYFCTHRGGYRELEIPVTGVARDRAAQVLGAIEDAIERGFLPAAPDHDACVSCDYRGVCGPYEERRVKRKATGGLTQLTAMRSLA